jgi:hypothetical protein
MSCSIRPLVLLAVVVSLLAARRADAATCTPTPTLILVASAAHCTMGNCALNEPITFTLYGGGGPYTPQACESVRWTLQEGIPAGPFTTVTNQSGVFQHTFTTATSAFVNAAVSNPNSTAETYSTFGAGMNVYESAGVAHFTVKTTFAPASVQYDTFDDSAIAGIRYQAVHGTLSFAPGEFEKTIDIPLIDDGTFEPTQRFTMHLSHPDTVLLLGTSDHFDFGVTIFDDDPPVTVSWSSPTYSATEGTGPATINVNRNGDASIAFDVSYQVVSPQSTVVTQGVLLFAANEMTESFTVPIADDSVFTGDRTDALILSNPSNPAQLGQSRASLVIHDDDPRPLVGWSSAQYTATEGGAPATLIVNRTADATHAFTVDYEVRKPDNSPLTQGTLSFAVNESTKTIAVTPVNDNIVTGEQLYSLALKNVSSPAILSRNTATLLVHEDDVAAVFGIDDVTMAEGNSGTTAAAFDVHLAQPSSVAVSVGVTVREGTAVSGSDFTLPAPATITFAPGETKKSFIVLVNGDIDVEANETFTATLSDALPTGATIARGTAMCTIVNDDAGLGPAEVRLASGTSTNLMLRLAQPAAGATAVAFTSSSPTVAGVPASIPVTAGAQSLSIELKALSAGASAVRAVLPAALGGATLTARVTVYEPVTLVIAPATLLLPVGATGDVSLSLAPASSDSTMIGILPTDASAVDVPSSITIPPSGKATLTVKALRRQSTSLTLTLPAFLGGANFVLPIEIAEGPSNPYVTQVAPPNGPAAGGTPVTITGANFAAPCTVAFGGSLATSVNVATAGSITAATPAHLPGVADVVITCGSTPAYTFSNGFTFNSAAPALSGISPSFGSTAGGTLVRVSGSALRSGCGVFFDGVAAHAVAYESVSAMTAVAPRHAEATVDVSLRCGGDNTSLKNAFTYANGDDPSPSISSVDPLFAAPGQPVTLTGSRFRAGDVVTFGVMPAAVLSSSPDRHVVRVPEMGIGKVAINLSDPNGHLTTTGPIFNVLEPLSPQITAISPASGAAGSEITIDGRGFRAPYSFGLGDHPATLVSLSFERAVIRVPRDTAAGSSPVTVLNAMHQIAAAGPSFTVMTTGPAIDSVTPGCATTDGRVEVTIRGTGFASGATVAFDGNAASEATIVDAATIRVSVPAGAVGAAKVTVKNPDGATASLTSAFRYVSPYDADGGCSGRLRPRR